MALRPEDIATGEALCAWQDFVRSHREQRHSARTIETYGEAVAQLAAWLAGLHPVLSLLTAGREQISDFLQEVGARTSAATQSNRHRALVQFYKFCVDEEILAASPMARIKAPAPDYKIPAVIPDEQLTALIAACAGKELADLRDSAIIRLWCEPGSPRASEMAGLRLADVDMDHDAVQLRGKTGARIIAMAPATARAMSRYLRARARHRRAAELDALWIGTKGPVTRSGLGQMLDRRAGAAGIGHIHPHQLRHTAFSDFDSASGNGNHAMALFGWSSMAMVHHYGKGARSARALVAARELNRAGRL